MSRIIEEQEITITREAVSPRIEITYDNYAGTGVIVFHLRDEVKHNGVYIGTEPHSRLRSEAYPGAMALTLAEFMGRSIQIDANTAISGVQMMQAVKQVFDDVFSERLSAQDVLDAVVPDPVE